MARHRFGYRGKQFVESEKAIDAACQGELVPMIYDPWKLFGEPNDPEERERQRRLIESVDGFFPPSGRAYHKVDGVFRVSSRRYDDTTYESDLTVAIACGYVLDPNKFSPDEV